MKKKLKIAYFLDNFFPQVNGVVTSSINTCKEIAKRGHQIMGFAPQPLSFDNYEDDYFPFPIVFQKGFPAYFYPDFSFTYTFSPYIFKKVKEFDPDIIHFHAPFCMGYQAIRAAYKLKKPVIGTFHTFFAEPEYLSLIGMDKSKFLINFGWWYSNQFFNRCDLVISPAIATAKFLIDKKLKNHIEIISNGVEVEKYSNFNFNFKLPVNIKENEDWLIYIGRLSGEKCLDILLESVLIAMSKKNNLKFVIVGDGPYKKEIEKIIKVNNIQDKIFLTGMIPNKQLLESGLLKKVKAFITASTSENQPMTILESIMFDLPIIGVNAKGVPELIEDNGFIVEPNNPQKFAEKILLLLSDKNLYNRFSAKSKELKHKYDIKNTTDKMENIYYNVIENYTKNLFRSSTF